MWTTVVTKVGEFIFTVNREKSSFVAGESQPKLEAGLGEGRLFHFFRMELETRGLYSLQRLLDSSCFCCERDRFTLLAKQ